MKDLTPAKVIIPKGFYQLKVNQKVKNGDYVLSQAEDHLSLNLHWVATKNVNFNWKVKPGVIVIRKIDNNEKYKGWICYSCKFDCKKIGTVACVNHQPKKCKICYKEFRHHNAKDARCPIGINHRIIGYTNYAKTVYTV